MREPQQGHHQKRADTKTRNALTDLKHWYFQAKSLIEANKIADDNNDCKKLVDRLSERIHDDAFMLDLGHETLESLVVELINGRQLSSPAISFQTLGEERAVLRELIEARQKAAAGDYE